MRNPPRTGRPGPTPMFDPMGEPAQAVARTPALVLAALFVAAVGIVVSYYVSLWFVPITMVASAVFVPFIVWMRSRPTDAFVIGETSHSSAPRWWEVRLDTVDGRSDEPRLPAHQIERLFRHGDHDTLHELNRDDVWQALTDDPPT